MKTTEKYTDCKYTAQWDSQTEHTHLTGTQIKKLSMARPLEAPEDLFWSVKVLVAQLCLTLCDPIDCSLSGSSVHQILQARILELVAIPFSRGSSWPRDRTWVSCTAGGFYVLWATHANGI